MEQIRRRIGEKSRRLVRMLAVVLSAAVTGMAAVPYFPAIHARAGNGERVVLTSAYGEYGGEHKLYCIDSGSYAFWGIADDGDVYERHRPSALSLSLTQKEQEYVFWGLLTLQASLGVRQAADAVARIRIRAQEEGREPITKLVTEEDLKALIYSASVRDKYPWLETATAHTEEYLRMGGLLTEGGGTLPSGKKVPEILKESTAVSSAYSVNPSDFTIHFDENGADAAFIRQVPLLFSADHGITFQPEPMNGWNYQKTDTEIIFTNPSPNPAEVLIRFAAEGTEFTSVGGYRSEKELFDACLQVWECSKCSGNHQGGTPPLSETWHHQRLVWMEFQPMNVGYYAVLGGGNKSLAGDGQVSFEVFRHEEDFTSHYNLKLSKYDYETGKALADSRFVLYERFDDAGEVNKERDGPVFLYAGGEGYAGGFTDAEPVWKGFRKAGSAVTDEEGCASQTAEHGYHYDKTFCNGHPAPLFTAVPEEEEDDETGEVLNEDEIAEAQSHNRKLALEWLACEKDCKEKAGGSFEGVHFHWLLSGVQKEVIKQLSESGGSPGSEPDAGETKGAGGEASFEASGCRNDRDKTYERFISLRYSYVWQEFQARDGYILHGLHADDLPIEVIRTDASEHAAASVFAGSYDLTESKKQDEQTSEVQIQEAEISSHAVPSVQAAGISGQEEFLFIDEEGWEEEKDDNEDEDDSEDEDNNEEGEKENEDEEKKEDRNGKRARIRASSSAAERATESEPVKEKASASELRFLWKSFSKRFSSFDVKREGRSGMTAVLFEPAYEKALVSKSTGETVKAGPSENFSHCNGRDPEGNSWEIYDHRTEGEFHINKKDMDLAAGETENYHARGETQGDASLEGAVYGLFASEDLIHPDGKTGVVYRAGDLAAIAATDKNGDASFLVYTQAPGQIYDYTAGTVIEREGGWAKEAPGNLYDSEKTVDDYTADHRYERNYQNNEIRNGNSWIGRPLLLGDYYVKELSRSEGYELSIGNRDQQLSNAGQQLDIGVSDQNGEETGRVTVIRNLSAEEQTSEDGEGAGPNELFFQTESEQTGKKGYKLMLTGLPEGASFYRKEVGTVCFETEIGTGIWEKKLCFDENGMPVYLRAEHDYQYPKYREDGSIVSSRVPRSLQADWIRQVSAHPIRKETIRNVLSETGEEWSEEELLAYLSQPLEEKDAFFVKEKVEQILRRSKKAAAGAEERVNGAALPAKELKLLKQKEDGTPLTVTDAIVQILAFYEAHPYFNCGGIESVTETNDQFIITVIASVPGHPEYFMVQENGEPLIYHRVLWTPQSSETCSRYVYVAYSNQPDSEAFGTYEEFQSGAVGDSLIGSALLVPDAVIDENGTPVPSYEEKTVYYETGELVKDAEGNLIQKFEYKEQTQKQTEEREEIRWYPCDVSYRLDGSYLLSAETNYRDSFGKLHTDENSPLSIEWKAVLKEPEVPLSQEEAEQLGAGFFAGHKMSSAGYYVRVKQARVKPWNQPEGLFGENSFLIPAVLSYPGQQNVWQDAGTREQKAQVYERVIRQKVRITKEISDTALPGFRFKLYLRSNLERLYRDEEGRITWLAKTGQEREPEQSFHAFFAEESFADVPKLYTKVLHQTDSQTTGSISNNVSREAVTANERLYSFDENGWIAEEQNTGYTRLLETMGTVTEAESASPTGGAVYNYEKFFDALRTANHDKWDQNAADSTSYKPFPLISASSEEAKENQKASDAVRQFAITWYLQEEVKKLTKTTEEGTRMASEGFLASQGELYEKALQKAIQKAENYLKPFFSYDLDEIYAVKWDASPDGGADKDKSTLSADEKRGDVYDGISKYLPYGIYVAAEQQPEIGKKGDFRNRHYQIDSPKEILIPTVCGEQEAYASEYQYDAQKTPEELAASYQIRMNEEWGSTNQADERRYVIWAHNQDGDFEVYPYGLSAQKRSGAVKTPEGRRSYQGFSFYQGAFAPEKAFYEEENPLCAGFYHKNAAVGAYYRYGSVSEQEGELLGKAAITGSLTGYENTYFPALVPQTVLEAENTASYAGKRYHNTAYCARLRLEKLDAETGEQILHDSAVFTIYRAEREEKPDGKGLARFYETDSLITGSRGFLEAMGAVQITPIARKGFLWELPYSGIYYGTVPAGTPICREEDQIIQMDETGKKTGQFKAFSTVRDGEEGNQTVGYLETPQMLDAGCYVLCEWKAPAGYVRNKPIAVEIYSDEVSYYLDGKSGNRVLSARYEKGDSAQVYVSNVPIRLEISKRKPEDTVVSYELNGRLEGSLAALNAAYGKENLEFAYDFSGRYLGYGWKKGFLDSLKNRQRAGEKLELIYENGVFSGRARLFYPVEKEKNAYLPGALLTLYEAIEIWPSGDQEDFRYAGVQVVRDRRGNVETIYVQKGYAGQRLCYVLEKTDPNHAELDDYQKYSWNQEINDSGNGIWTVQTIEREDTDILFYDLSGLTLRQDGTNRIFAYQDGICLLEIEGSSLSGLHYNGKDKVFDQVPEGTLMYHLDSEGIRDSLVDPYTGMAYVREEETGKYMVWPVKVSRDAFGNITAREKIRTCRPASVYADSEEEYSVGSWNGTGFVKQLNPVLDVYGRPIYYPRSPLCYQKGSPVYDRDGDYIRYRYDDRLLSFNWNAWQILEERLLLDIEENPLFHRQGEAYLIENTWYSGEETPNAPFRSVQTVGQPDLLKRVPAGVYILEELRAPAGYVRAMPSGLTVQEKTEIQKKRVTDVPIRAAFEKADQPETYQVPLLDPDRILEEAVIRTEGKGSYSYEGIEGAELALYPAVRDPNGGLKKKSALPFSYTLPGENRTICAEWTSSKTPHYLEKLPKGLYLLEEKEAPPGFLPASMEIEIQEKEELQSFSLPNDHTKLEFLKYLEQDGSLRPAMASDGAELALYEAELAEDGTVQTDGEGRPLYREEARLDQWRATDCREYFGTGSPADSFPSVYEALWDEYGTSFAFLTWKADGKEKKAVRIRQEQTDACESVRQLWRTEDGKEIFIAVSRGLSEEEKYGYSFDYKFNYRVLDARNSPYAVSYDTVYGTHRIDYADCGEGKVYVLAETIAPTGCKKAEPRVIWPKETAAVQLYTMKNEPGYLEIWKVTENEEPLPGAELALYRAGEAGEFVQSEEFLIDQWISQEKPHRISSLAEGIYYLAELKAPEGFAVMEPKRILAGDSETVCIKAENELKKGQLELLKLDAENKKGLSEAVYELSCLDTGESWKLMTGEDGRVKSPLLTTGSVKNGTWIPYRFSLQEIKPPRCHVLDRSRILFHFEETESQTQKEEMVLTIRKELSDEPTRIEISKTVFGNGTCLSGAKLSVYSAKQQDGCYEAEGEALESWISDGTAHVICGKLSAGEVYLLVEEDTPPGYEKRKPQLFSLSEDGLQTADISSDLGMLRFQMSEEFPDQVEALSIWGRQALRSRRILSELESGTKENPLYEETEETYFSDGTRQITGRRIVNRKPDEETSVFAGRIPEETRISLWKKAENGEEMEAEWKAECTEEQGYLYTIRNPEYQEKSGISTVSRNGILGNAVLPGSVLRYEICCANPGTEEKKMRIHVRLDEKESFMPAASDSRFHNNGSLLTAEIVVKAGGEERFLVAAAVASDAETCVSVRASIDGKEYTELHPVAESGTVTILNRVSGTGAASVEGTFAYRITFLDQDRVPWKEEEIYLKKGEMLTFKGLPWGTICCAEEKRESRQDSELQFTALSEAKKEVIVGKTPETIRFSYEKRDGSCRELFQKNTEYLLREVTGYSDGSELLTGMQSFSLDEEGHVTQFGLTNKKTEVQIEKRDLETGDCLEGAGLQLFLEGADEKQELLLEEWYSKETGPHLVQAVLSPGDCVVLREKQAPNGYQLAKEMRVVLPEDGGLLTLCMEDQPIHVIVKKLGLGRDGSVLGPLAGAVIRIEKEDGTFVCRFESGTDGEWDISSLLEQGICYRAVEESAPAGYELAEPVLFTVSGEETEQEIILYDRKKEKTGDRERNEKPHVPTEGTITVAYSEFLDGTAFIRLPYQRLASLPETGEAEEKEDWKNTGVIWLMLFLSAVLLWSTVSKKERKKAVFLVLLLVTFTVAGSMQASAAAVSEIHLRLKAEDFDSQGIPVLEAFSGKDTYVVVETERQETGKEAAEGPAAEGKKTTGKEASLSEASPSEAGKEPMQNPYRYEIELVSESEDGFAVLTQEQIHMLGEKAVCVKAVRTDRGQTLRLTIELTEPEEIVGEAEALKLEGGTAHWKAAPGASAYYVMLYRNGKRMRDGHRTEGTGFDFSALIKTEGNYFFRVFPLTKAGKKGKAAESMRIQVGKEEAERIQEIWRKKREAFCGLKEEFSGWCETAGGWYYCNRDGTFPSETHLELEGQSYYFDETGRWADGLESGESGS